MKELIQTFFKFVIPFFLLFFTACGVSEQSFIDEPQVGDVYQIECHNIDGHDLAYQLVKVKEIRGDTLRLAPNRMYYHEKVYCLAAGDYFDSRIAYASTKEKIKSLFVADTIIEVFRYYEDACLGNDK